MRSDHAEVHKIKESLQKEGKKLSEEARQKTASYVEAGLGIIAGLAWNEAVKALIEYFLPFSGGTVLAKFIYAVVMTFIVVVVSVYLTRVLKRSE